MFRSLSVIFVVILCMIISGCAAIRHLDGSADEDTKKFRASIDQLTKQVANLSKDVEDLKKEVEQSKVATKNEIAKADVEKKAAPQPATVEKSVEPKALRVKVLSGNGKISSAREMSEKLKKLGYEVENTGLASRSNFDVITVYFAPDYKNEAQHVATQLGGGAVAKPLTWQSGFHVIVVTGP